MSKFTVEETNSICIYNTGSREDLITELSKMKTHLQKDEMELLELVQSVLDKITAITDSNFNSIIAELIANFEE